MRRWTLAIVALAVAGGCARRETPPPAGPAPRPPSVVTPAPGVEAPLAYMTTASSIDRFMIRAAELAEARARDARLRNFAAEVKRDHEAIAAQLSFAGRRLNQLPTGRLLDNHAARLAALEVSADFDAAYRREMGRSLSAAYEYHNRYASKGESPTLRPVARFAAQTIAGNVQQLRGIR